MQRLTKYCSWVAVVMAVLVMVSCEKEMDRYYEVPGWLKGNARQLLESKGGYSVFLKAVEMAGYGDMISGKGIITVVAPSDEAFNAYLSAKGYSGLDQVPADELKKLVGFHLVYYAFDKAKFANYRPEGISDVTTYQDAGLYYKFRTKSSSGIETYKDGTVAVGDADSLKKVYHKERFVPVLSSYLFATKGIDAAANYEYFYPDSKWSGAGGGFNISNASVTEYAIVADNGYVYTTDKVLEPLETIHDELGASKDFTLFKKMYDRFANFTLDATATENYGNGEKLYLYYHTELPKIASEWSYNGEGVYDDYANLAELARDASNVFAPSNASLTNFFNEFWQPYYSSLDSVPFLPIGYLLYNHVYSGDVVFPEEIANGKVTTSFGTTVSFNTADVSLKKMCTNGTLYGLNNLMVPRMFQSVTAPAFQRPQYKIFLQMLCQTGMPRSLMSPDVDFRLFIPTDRVIESNTTIDGKLVQYQNLNPKKYGAQEVMIEGDVEPWVNMSYSTMSAFVNNHVGTKLICTVGNKKVYKTLNSFQYLLVEDDSKVYSSYIFNNLPDKPAPAVEVADTYNGKSYELNGQTEFALVQDYSLFKDQITKNTPTGMTSFKQLLVASQFPTSAPPYSFLQGERFVVFVPTDAVVNKGFTSIPYKDPKVLAEYMKYYFVNVNETGLGDYPFPGAGIQGELTTFKTLTDGTRAKLTLIDNGSGLQVRDAKGNTVNVVGVFPRIYDDGAAYVIDGLLSAE